MVYRVRKQLVETRSSEISRTSSAGSSRTGLVIGRAKMNVFVVRAATALEVGAITALFSLRRSTIPPASRAYVGLTARTPQLKIIRRMQPPLDHSSAP